jgi:glutathione peroxidase
VNVASKCCLKPQQKSLEALYPKHGDEGLEILGLPAKDFAA